jgi:acetoin utilization protein AcuB
MHRGIDVKNWMSGDPVTVEPEASALEALELMLDRGIRHLVVVDHAPRVVGVMSLDDLRAVMPFPVRPGVMPTPKEREMAREWSVAEIMTPAPETIDEEASLSSAAQRMASLRIGCLPVVDSDGNLAGLLSGTDVMHAMATALWSDEVAIRSSRSSTSRGT